MAGVIFSSDTVGSIKVRLDAIGVFIAAIAAASDDGVAALLVFETFSNGRFLIGTILFGVAFLLVSLVSLFLERFLLFLAFGTALLCWFSDVVDCEEEVLISFRVFFVGNDRLSILGVRFFVAFALDFTSSGSPTIGTIPTE